MESLLTLVFCIFAVGVCVVITCGTLLLVGIRLVLNWVTHVERDAEDEYGREQVKRVKKALKVVD